MRKTLFTAVSCHGTLHASGQSPQDYPLSFPFPNINTYGSFLSLLAGLSIFGLHPQACKSCSCPVSRLKKEPRDGDIIN